MGDAEKTTILAAAPAGYGAYRQDERWDDEDEEARRRRRKIIAIVAVLAVLLLGGAIAAAIALSGGGNAKPTTAKVNVPGVQNLDQAAAEKAITDAGLKVGDVSQAPSTSVAQGKVISSDPAGGASVAKGSTVKLVVSAGPDTLAVPNVVGLSEDRARATLKGAGFTSVSSRPTDSLEDEGNVVAVDPAEGQQAAKNTTITLKISTGTIKVPDVKGKTAADATKALTDAGFSAGQIRSTDVDPGSAAPGTVVSTDPGTGTAVGRGDTITLQVAKADTTKTIPDVAGQTEAQARASLAAAGFTKVKTQGGADGSTPNTAAGTDPPAGTKADPADEILLLIVG